MKTDELIKLLSEDNPVRMPLARAMALALIAGATISAIIMILTIGMRPHLMEMVVTMRMQFKVLETLFLAAIASRLVFLVGRPEVSLKNWSLSLLLPLAALAIAVFIEMKVAPEDSWHQRMMGHYAVFCLTLIPFFALAPLAAFMIVLKNAAPRNPALAGAIAGLAAGAVSAAIYSWHCVDDSPFFVASWYTIAIAIVTFAGFLIGRRLLRW